MLIEFRAENHRSLRDEQVLTMEAGNVGDKSNPRPRKVAGYPKDLLTVAALYGANASGKSNVLSALAFMCEAVVMSHQLWSPGNVNAVEPTVPRHPFAWGPKREEPSLFEATFLLDQVRYQYGFQVSDEKILEEWFLAWPNERRQLWFEREEQKFKFGNSLKGENKVIAEVTRPNALFLSAAIQHAHPQLARVFPWFRKFEIINLPGGIRYARALLKPPHEFVLGQFLARSRKDESYRPILEGFRNLMKHADVGIVDFKTGRNPHRQGPKLGSELTPDIFVKHQGAADDAWLLLEEESQGTQTLFEMALPLLAVLKNGGVLLIDELERSLHPSLARQIIRQFNDPTANPKNAQIIFTTHDTNLLGTTLGDPPLRRDQVWLTEKNAEGATELYPLTDYKPRKAENLERGYLQGRYGAIPFLGDFLVKGD